MYVQKEGATQTAGRPLNHTAVYSITNCLRIKFLNLSNNFTSNIQRFALTDTVRDHSHKNLANYMCACVYMNIR